MRLYKLPYNLHFTSKEHSLHPYFSFLKDRYCALSDMLMSVMYSDAMEGSCPRMRVRPSGVSNKVGWITFALPPLRPWPS